MPFPSNDNLMAQLIQNGYSGDINTSLVRYLRAQYSLTGGQYNDLLFYHLGQLGYTGSLNDRIRQWDGTLFSPLALFSAGEKGVWYDPSDFSTLYQDSAGTTAAVVGQPVGLVLDKSKGLVIGPELVTNGTFDSGTTGWAVTAGGASIASVSGELQITAGAGGGLVAYTISTVIGKTYKLEVTGRRGTYTQPPQFGFGTTSTSTPTQLTFTTTSNVSKQAVYTATGTTTYVLARFPTLEAGATIYFDNISVKELPGYHATQATSTARPVLQQDANGKYYLAFDGTDDFLVTSAIDFTATDKMSVFAGVRKLSDSVASGMVVELGANGPATDNGMFNIQAPGGATNGYRVVSKGTVQATADSPASYPQPHTAVISLLASISTDSLANRVNGAQVGSAVTDQGTGNYGNYALYVGMRGGTTIPLNGRLYSLIVRGALSDAAQIAAAEAYVNSKTAAY